jgi:chromate transporter
MDETGSAPSPALHRGPGIGPLFLGFLTLGITGFGGVLPLARRMLVQRRQWLTADEFTELLGLCQFLPGGNIINMSVAVGMRFRGWRGALACVCGLILVPTAVVVGLGVLYSRFATNPYLAHAFAGLAAAAAGLLTSLALRTLAPLRRSPVALVIVLVTVVAIAVARLPLVPVMIGLAVLSIWLRPLDRPERAAASPSSPAARP